MALIYCSECGNQVSDNAVSCPKCGNVLNHKVSAQAANQACPETYLGRSIATIFFCWPVGIPAVLYATKVTNKFLSGDYSGAVECSLKAKKWSTAAIISSIIFWIGYAIFWVIYFLVFSVIAATV